MTTFLKKSIRRAALGARAMDALTFTSVRLVSGALAAALIPRFQDRQVDVPVGQIAPCPGLADFLQTEYLLVEGRGLLGVRRPDGDVLDPGHARLLSSMRLSRGTLQEPVQLAGVLGEQRAVGRVVTSPGDLARLDVRRVDYPWGPPAREELRLAEGRRELEPAKLVDSLILS